MKPLNELTITEARDLLSKGEVSALDITEACLGAIKAKDDDIHAYLEVFADAREQAKNVSSGTLSGIPLAVKDNILIEGRRASGA